MIGATELSECRLTNVGTTVLPYICIYYVICNLNVYLVSNKSDRRYCHVNTAVIIEYPIHSRSKHLNWRDYYALFFPRLSPLFYDSLDVYIACQRLQAFVIYIHVALLDEYVVPANIVYVQIIIITVIPVPKHQNAASLPILEILAMNTYKANIFTRTIDM
jgi:hypothetical protein